MAAVSAWSKPGAWALEAEEQDEQLQLQLNNVDKGYASSTDSHQSASADFPSLSAASTTKIPKRKPKKQTLSLAEFTTTKFSDDAPLLLPTGPRERSAEELDRSRLGGGFRYNSYNSDGARGSVRGSDETRRERREPRALDSGPSRADEVDDWAAMKKPLGAGSEKRERGFFGSSSKADESDNWISAKKSYVAPSGEGKRERRSYDLFNREGSNGIGVDSDSWGRKREENGGNGLGSDNGGRKREENGGSGGADADNWGKKKGEDGGSGSGIGRPRLVLQPRSAPLVNGNNGEGEKKGGEVVKGGGKGANPFGEARPREEVLKEKGMDWKEINEKLEVVKIKEGEGLRGRKGNELKDDRTERAWRKPETPSPRS